MIEIMMENYDGHYDENYDGKLGWKTTMETMMYQ